MKIAFNPSTVAALTTPPNNKDITFDLRGRNIFARGVKFYGTDTNTWRDIKINNVSIGSNILDLRNGSNTTLTNTNGVVTINSTWRPVVDNLTSDSTTSSLSAKQGKVLKALIDGKSNSDHNHDGRYVRYYAVTTLDCNNLAAGLTAARISATNTAHTNHSAYLYISDVGTPFQIQIPDSSIPYIYKRYYGSGKWSGWFKLSAGYADSAGSVAWANVTGKPSSYTPSAHTHAWNSLTHSSTTENQAILTNGKANGWKLQTLNIARWDNAANNAHSHANKSVLDGITSALVNSWNTAYNFVSNITGTDTDKVINKWEEIVNFLAGITEDNKLNTLLNSKLSVYELANNTNVGTIKNNGIYYSTTDASSGTLINSPFNTGFALINMTSCDGGDDLRRSRLAFNAYGEIKVSDDRDQANTAETWYNVLTSKNSGISGSTIKLNGTSITVYSSGTADGRYVKKSGDTMSGVLTIDATNFGALTIKRNDDANGASIQFRGKSSVYGYIGLNNSTKDKQFLRWSSDTSRIYTILDTSSTYISNGKGVINGTTITQVNNATNSTNSTNARKLVNWYSARPTSLNAQFGDGSLRIFYATSSTTEGKSPDDAAVLHLAWDNNSGWDSQLAISNSQNRVYSRSQNAGTWQPWKTLAFTTDIPSALKNPYSFNVFGVVYDGSAAKTVTTSTFISQVTEGTSTITDGTMLITSYASNSGFADTNAVNVPYKRKAIHLWEYIKAKTDSLYATKGHNHDGKYLKLTGGTMLGALNFANNTWNLVGDDSYIGDCNISGHFGIKAANTTYPGITFFNNASTFLGNLTAYSGNIKYGAYSLQFLDNGNTSVSASTWTNPFSNYNSNAVADGQAICVWGQYSYLSNLSTDNGNMSLWLKRINANMATLNMVLDGEYYANGNQRLAHVSEIPNKDSWNYDDRYLKLTGGWMSGDINFGGDKKIHWGRNTDSASISFKNDGDGDANSYMSFVTSDNGNEYFRWSHSSGSTNTEWMALRSDGLRVRGTKVSLEGHSHNDLYYTKAESNAKYITDIATSVNKLTFTKNGSNIIRDITVNVVHSQGYLTNIPNKDATTKAIPGLFIYNSYNQVIGTNSYSSVLSINTGGTIQIAGNWGDDHARNLYWRSQSDRNVADYPWKSWRTILDSENYSSTLDSRYYTESEVNSLLDAKLNRQNLSYGTWNPRGWNLAADYHYNGGDISISENNGKMYVSVDGCFWQNEGQYRVLDTSDIGDIRDSVTLHQYLSATDAAWYPLVWGGASHNNTSDSTGPIYKSYDKLSWQTSSQTLYATHIQTNNIKNLSIGGGIYWDPNVESGSDGSDAASITLVRSGVAGGTTLVLSQMNDTNDTIQFKTNTAARLYHNSYPILTTQNTYVSNNKGYINGTEITQVNNSDKWITARTFTIGNTSKSVDGSSNVSWSLSEIGAASSNHNHDNRYVRKWTGVYGHANKFLKLVISDEKGWIRLEVSDSNDALDGGYGIYIIGWSYHGNNSTDTLFAGCLYANYSRYTTALKVVRTSRNNYDFYFQFASTSSYPSYTINYSDSVISIDYTVTAIDTIPTATWTSSLSALQLNASQVDWSGITNKPSTFNPAAHTHTVFKNNLMIKGTNGISDSASIHLGIGDSDTGFKWISDGVCQIYANNVAIGQWTSGGMNWFINPTVNGNKVWNAGNDGSGSGLDADTLDGYHETKFFRHRGNTNKNESPLKYTSGTFEYYGNLPAGMSNVYDWGGSLVSGGDITSLQFYYPDPSNDKSIYARTFWNNNDSGWHKLAFTDSKVADSDKLDGVHLNGLLTALSNSNKGISITVGGTTKSVSNISVNYANSATNADMVDGYHATDGRTFNGDINWGSWHDTWSDGTHTHPWYGFDRRYPNTGAYSTTISDYHGMTIKTDNTLLLDCGTLLLNSRNNVGIGTNSPAYKLHVNGTFRATNSTVSDLFVNTGDATLKIYTGITADAQNDGNICFQTSIDATDGQSHAYPTQYQNRCNIVLQPRGGQVYIGTNPGIGNTTYKLYVNSKIFSNGGFVKNGSSDSYVLLGGGGHTLLSSLNGSHNHDERYVRAFGTSNDNIDSDWGQSFKTFDPIPSGTPPEQNPNISILNIGENFNRRKQLAFIWNNDNIYYRRRTDSGFTNWRRLAFTSDIPTVTNYYWANVKISASSSTTTSPIVSNLTATSSIRMSNISLEHTDEINNNTNGGIHLNYRNSGNVSLCYGGGNVGIGTTTPSYKLDVNGQMRASGFHHSSVNSDNYILLAGGGYKSFGGDDSTPIFLGYLNLYNGNDGTISSSFPCLGYSVPFTYTRGGAYCLINIPNTSFQTFYIKAAIASVHYSGAGMGHWVGNHRGDGAWWLHCDAVGSNAVQVKGFHLANENNDSWWGGNPLYSGDGAAKIITVCLFGYVKFR